MPRTPDIRRRCTDRDRQPEVDASLQARLLERGAEPIRDAGVDGGVEHHELTTAQTLGDFVHQLLGRAVIDLAAGHQDDVGRKRSDGAGRETRVGKAVAAGDLPLAEVGAAVAQRADSASVSVDADDGKALLGRGEQQVQPAITETHDCQRRGSERDAVAHAREHTRMGLHDRDVDHPGLGSVADRKRAEPVGARAVGTHPMGGHRPTLTAAPAWHGTRGTKGLSDLYTWCSPG